MSPEIIFTSNAPAPIGPYSQAIRYENTVYVSGQIPIEPQSGEMVEGDIQMETRRVMDNVCAVLHAAQSDPSRILKTSIFLTDMNDFAAVNEVYATYFSHYAPARETIQVVRLPKNARVEISVIACCTPSA